MIAAADGAWPTGRPITTDAPALDEVAAVERAIILIGRLLALTGNAAERIEAGEQRSTLEFLDERDDMFGELGTMLGIIASRVEGDTDGGSSLNAESYERLAAAANELGRLDAVVAARLAALRDGIDEEMKTIRPPGDGPPPDSLDPGSGRHLDVRG